MYKLMLLIVAAMALIATATNEIFYTYPHQIATYPSVYTYPAYHYPLAYSSAYPSVYTLLRR